MNTTTCVSCGIEINIMQAKYDNEGRAYCSIECQLNGVANEDYSDEDYDQSDY